MTQFALVRLPSPRLAEGLVTHIDRSPVDADLALQQWNGYVAALQQNGWATTEVAPAPRLPDSAFVEDTMVVFRDVVVLARPGADERKPEVAAAAEAVRRFGYREVAIEAPGTLDGGDVLKVGDTIYVGNGGRTNGAGIAQLAAAVEPLGATVVTVPLNKVLHLKSAVTALPDGTIIGWEPAIDDISVFPRFLGMPEESGSHVVLLGGDKVLMSSDCPRSAVLLRSAGLEPVLVDISEFIKLEGCVTCLSVRLREAPHAPQH
ncbi:MAG: N(G),N(G)-dimethylarginine dimethylaminohydrolase [Actinobacteria bacterium]|nr:N(G),N(G)-dimethylarginine dimethylaminohydrolase [Actinomycetota bacterium]